MPAAACTRCRNACRSPLWTGARAGRESIASAAQCRTRRSAAEHTEPRVNMAWGWAIVRAPVGGGVMAPRAPGVAPRASAPASLHAGQSTKKQPRRPGCVADGSCSPLSIKKPERKRVGEGQGGQVRVDIGVCRFFKKQKKKNKNH